MDNDSTPLDETHFALLQEARKKLAMARSQIEKATRAGISNIEQKDKVQELDVQINKLRDAYFPGRTL